MKRARARLKEQLKEKQSNNFLMFDFIAPAFLKYILFICYLSMHLK